MKNGNSADTVELNIAQIALALLRRCWLILLCAVICGSATYWTCMNWITPRYASTVTFYVNNDSFAVDNRLSSSDLYASENLMGTYIVILSADQTMRSVAEVADVDIEPEPLLDMLEIRTIPNTVLFQVTVNDTDPQTVGKLAQSIAQVLPERINTIMEGVYISVADSGVTPTSPASPSTIRNTICAILFGGVFGASLIVLNLMFDTAIKTEADIPRNWDVPVLASIPERAKPAKARKKGRKKKQTSKPASQQMEAYNFLRAKVEMAVSEDGCCVIGIASAMAGEGKSTTAVNLSRALALDGQRVLLMDCDLRRPTLHKKLHVAGRPGITEILARQFPAQELLKTVNIAEKSFHLLTAGMLPPNPAELLNSGRMKEEISGLRPNYDYVILDLPPVGEVSDALAVAGNVDAFILVTRAKRCDVRHLKAAIRSISTTGKSVLGIVLNCTKK